MKYIYARVAMYSLGGGLLSCLGRMANDQCTNRTQLASTEVVCSGVLKNKDGTPVEGAKLELREGSWAPMWSSPPDKTESISLSKDDGSFRIVRPSSGDWRVLITKEAHSPLALDLQECAGSKRLTLLPSVEVSGRVVNNTGADMEDLVVFARLREETFSTPRPVPGWNRSSWRGQVLSTGDYRIDGLPIGMPVQVWASREDAVPQPVRTVVPDSRRMHDVTIVLQAGAVIEGTIKEKLSPHAKEVWIKEASMKHLPFARRESPIVFKTAVDSFGRYRFNDVCDGDWVVGYTRSMGEYAYCETGRCALVTVDTAQSGGKYIRLDFNVP